MVSGAIATQVITTTHRLATTLVVRVATQARGIPIRTTLAIVQDLAIKVTTKANGATPGIAPMSTATKSQAKTRILSALAVP